MSLKDCMPDRTFWVVSLGGSALCGFLFDIPWWAMWVWFFGLFLPISFLFGWLLGDHTITGEPKRDHPWRP